MRWLKQLLKRLFGSRPSNANRPRLMGIYFDESNSTGRRKPNRERS